MEIIVSIHHNEKQTSESKLHSTGMSFSAISGHTKPRVQNLQETFVNNY